jgi:hypothetical protein
LPLTVASVAGFAARVRLSLRRAPGLKPANLYWTSRPLPSPCLSSHAPAGRSRSTWCSARRTVLGS